MSDEIDITWEEIKKRERQQAAEEMKARCIEICSEYFDNWRRRLVIDSPDSAKLIDIAKRGLVAKLFAADTATEDADDEL